jgi:hypothetical protein
MERGGVESYEFCFFCSCYYLFAGRIVGSHGSTDLIMLPRYTTTYLHEREVYFLG